VGKTNVGKSTLLNQLLHEEKAIVSDIYGTTRDVIEDTTDINGITFRFIDTAGIRHTDDKVEQIGIERAYQKLDEARIVLWLIDACPSEEEFSLMEKRCEGKKLIIVRNKIDKDTTDNDSAICTEASAHDKIAISAKYGKGITALEDLLYKAADIPEISDNDVVVSNARHYEALTRAKKSITQVILGLQGDLSGDLIAEDLRACIHELAEIVGGEVTSQETLNNIFKHFCVGK
jgi:tRNA modification GTPase